MNTLNFVVSRILFAAGVFSFLCLVFCITTEHSEQLKILLALTVAFCSFGIFSELSYRRYQAALISMNSSNNISEPVPPKEEPKKKPRATRKRAAKATVAESAK